MDDHRDILKIDICGTREPLAKPSNECCGNNDVMNCSIYQTRSEKKFSSKAAPKIFSFLRILKEETIEYLNDA